MGSLEPFPERSSSQAQQCLRLRNTQGLPGENRDEQNRNQRDRDFWSQPPVICMGVDDAKSYAKPTPILEAIQSVGPERHERNGKSMMPPMMGQKIMQDRSSIPTSSSCKEFQFSDLGGSY
jgi:hypothetical protein